VEGSKSSRNFLLAAVVSCTLTACQTTTTEVGTGYKFPDEDTESILDSKLNNLSKEVEKYPKRHDLHYRIAGVHFQKADYHESAQALERAIALSPEDSKYHFQLGRVYLRMQELEIAEEHFRKATRLSPPDRYSGPHAALGLVLSLNKDYKGAIAEFKKCIQIDPENPLYYYSLGAQYDIVGNTEGAIRNFKEYLLRGGVRYRKNATFILRKLGVDVEALPPPRGRPAPEELWDTGTAGEPGDVQPAAAPEGSPRVGG
jgi:tetratricopeptide (TPR) repeat protein